MKRANLKRANEINEQVEWIDNTLQGNSSQEKPELANISFKVGDQRSSGSSVISLHKICEATGIDEEFFKHLYQLVELQVIQKMKDQRDELIDELDALD